MRFHSFVPFLLAVATNVIVAEELRIPWVEEVVASMTDKFSQAVTYDGPTGTALASLIAAKSITKTEAKATAVPRAETPSSLDLIEKRGISASESLGWEAKIDSRAATPYWLETIKHQGISAFNTNPSTYVVFRNVKSYGAKGDGVTDDTVAINNAISDGGRCAPGSCNSATTTPAIVYFPAGTYVISSSIIDYYYTQIIGNPNDMPVLKATAGFTGFGLIDGDRYGPGGVLQFGATNTFYRQIRNIVFDMRGIPASSAATGVHWPTGQATSLQNCVFRMSDVKGTQHQGMFIESGSGGFMNDLVFYGGLNGVVFGNQQFTVRNLTFYNAVTAINQLWDWGWTYTGITVVNCTKGLDMSNGGASAQTVGSVTILDSTFTNTNVAILMAHNSTSQPPTAGSLIIDNVQLNNVVIGLQGPQGTVITGGTKKLTGYRQGHSYTPNYLDISGTITPFPRPAALLTNGKYYARSKPQYETLPATSFVSVRTLGAKGDGKTDDTSILNTILKNAATKNQVVFFDAGTYRITGTLHVYPGNRIVGESYSVIMGTGSYFSNINSPQVVVRVGSAGDTGIVEWSDMIVSTQGPTAGAILIQWNIKSTPSSPSGMWDVHTRIGGFQGSNLLYANCPAAPASTTVNTNCIAAFMSMQIGKTAQGLYMENVWLWVADHDIEDPTLRQTTIYAGRGLYSESTLGNFWLIGTSVEHHTLYQYQLANTPNVMMGQIQTETAYYQPNPKARSPFSPLAAWNDPSIQTSCVGVAGNCEDGWGLRLINTTNTFVYGAGLYSFFNNYSTKCSDAGNGASCQSRIFSVEGAGAKMIGVYNLNTIGSVSMITVDGKERANYSPNMNVFPQTVALFRNY